MTDAPVPKSGNTLAPYALKLRRLVLLDRARIALGGAERLAIALGMSRRAVNYKLTADRGLTDFDVERVALALDAHAAATLRLAADLRATSTMLRAAR